MEWQSGDQNHRELASNPNLGGQEGTFQPCQAGRAAAPQAALVTHDTPTLPPEVGGATFPGSTGHVSESCDDSWSKGKSRLVVDDS